MTRRSTTLTNEASVDITREIASKYDDVKTVADKITEVETVANADLVQMSADIQEILDFTDITVVTGFPASWDANTKVLTVEKGDKGDPGNDGAKGDTGDTGAKGEQGDAGVSVHHIKGTNTTDPEGDFATAGETDTYTLWGDAGETINLGFFTITNGSVDEATLTAKVLEASNSADAAAQSETNAALSANTATLQATNATNSASAAAASEANASTSESNAATSATNAANSAIAASTSETNAANSEANASTSATNASNSEANAATSETNAANSASAAANSYDSFDDRYLGEKASDPSLDNDGDPLITGAIYWNTTNDVMRVYNGTSWIDITSSNSLQKFYFTATAAQTLFSGLDDFSNTLTITLGLEQVYLNGVLLEPITDYTVTTTSITLIQAANVDDELSIIALGASDIDDVVAASTGGTFTSDGQRTINLNRLNSDGTILELQINGSSVGYLNGIAGELVLSDGTNSTTIANIGKKNEGQTWTGAQRGSIIVDNDLSFDLTAGNHFLSTPTGNGTLQFTNMLGAVGQGGVVVINNSGGHIISAPATLQIAPSDLSRLSVAGLYYCSYHNNGSYVYVSVSQAVTVGGA